MSYHRNGCGWILLVAAVNCSPALAQQEPASAGEADQLGEILVTATRREATIQEIPLSVSAVSSQEIEDRGLKTAEDLVQSVTSLHISPGNGGGVAGSLSNPDVSIRGIRSTTGAATTGIYIDDVPLQQRNAPGISGGGTVFPQLFDLERVEVLRGPQGTLYGGSSEGGTVRFITPQPNFDEPTLNTRIEGSSTQFGDPNAEAGLTVGGPLIKDVLAVRVSGWYRHDGGYIDHVSQFTGDLLPGGSNTNSEDHRALHAAIAYKPIDDLTMTLSYVIFRNEYRDSDEYWASIPQFQNLLGTFPPGPGKLYTYCPCNFGPYKSGQNTNIGENFYTSDAQLSPLLSQSNNSLSLPSFTVDYAIGPVTIKSVTAFAQTTDDSNPNFSFVDTASRSVTPLEAPYNALPNNSPYIATLADYHSQFYQHNHLNSLTEELRASSNANSRLSWVGGFFYDYTKANSSGLINANTGDLAAAALFGFPSAAAAPPPIAAGFAPLNGVGLVEPQTFDETQEALFGEATFKVTEALRLTAGARVTRDEFNYHLEQGGALFGFAPGVLATVADGSVTQTPVTPKAGVQYVVDPDLNFYATASKGFRPGGVNQSIPPACQASLNESGYPNGAPLTYGSDSLWSYELGSKWRTWDGRASIEASTFYIDWKGVQTPITLQCGQSFTVSTGKVISKGGDLQTAFLLFPGFTLTANAAYTDARYADAVTAGSALLIGKGDELPYTPKWAGNLSAEYKFQVAAHQSFVRVDWGYQGNFVQGPQAGPGTSTYLPDAYRLPGNRIVNARAGLKFGKADVQLFVQNLTNSQDLLSLNGMASGPGRVSCTTAACGPGQYAEYAQGAVLSTYRPRTVGVDLEYRY